MGRTHGTLAAGPDLVLAPDPYGQEKDGTGNVVYQHSGSYLVFRKLEQYVRAFKEREQQFAQTLGLPESGCQTGWGTRHGTL